MERPDLDQWKAREVARLLALLETERRYYEDIVSALPIGVLILSSDLAIQSANRAVRKLLGLRSGDALRGSLDALLPGSVRDLVQEVFKTGARQDGIPLDREGRKLQLSVLPIRRWESLDEVVLLIEEPAAGAAVPEPALEVPEPPAEKPPPEPQAPAFPAAELIDTLDAVVWALDLSGNTFLFASERARQILGYPPEHWTSTPDFWSERVDAADRGWVTDSYARAIARGESHTCEFRALAADGRTVWLRESARTLNDSSGQPKYLTGISVDVTERRLLENQYAQSERVEAVTRLASRMAHDLNNMLMILTGYSEELLNAIPAGSPLRGDVQEILNATERMSGLTSQLLVFSRRHGNSVGVVNLEHLLSGLSANLRAAAGQRVAVELKLSTEAVSVKAVPEQLEQAIQAIHARALQSIPEDGHIGIDVSVMEIREDLRRAGAPLSPGSYGVITVSISGASLEGESLAALFESALPGKDPLEESAAAVSRAYSAIRQWGGDIAVSSSARGGSVFQIFLPRVEVAATAPDEQPAAEAAPAVPQEQPRLETILLVEDESGIRALVRKILHRQGYRVLEAASGEDALAISGSHADKIDLLITDVVMPHMGGRQLAERLREQRAGLKVLYVSGYTDDASIYNGVLGPGSGFLQKPFTLGSLLDKVRELLAAK